RIAYPRVLSEDSMRPTADSLAALAFMTLWGMSFMPGPVSAAPVPPVAEKRPHEFQLHGESHHDDYAWLRDKQDPAVHHYLEAETAYADSLTHDQQPLRDRLYAEMLARIQQTDLSVPYRKGTWLYYTRTEEGKQYPIYCRKHGESEPEH